MKLNLQYLEDEDLDLLSSRKKITFTWREVGAKQDNITWWKHVERLIYNLNKKGLSLNEIYTQYRKIKKPAQHNNWTEFLHIWENSCFVWPSYKPSKKPPTKIPLDNKDHFLEKIDGIWYEVWVEIIVHPSITFGTSFFHEWSKEVKTKKQLNRWTLKQLGLKNG